jgi:hypothetical protein
MEFNPGDRIKVFTSPGLWMAVEVYAVGPDWLTVGNGDPIYHGNEIRDSFRVHKSDARPDRPLETGDVVAVLSASGDVAYYGEVQSLPDPASDAALFDRGKVGIFNPETDEVHYVAAADGEGFREATEAESDAYIDRWVDSEE